MVENQASEITILDLVERGSYIGKTKTATIFRLNSDFYFADKFFGKVGKLSKDWIKEFFGLDDQPDIVYTDEYENELAIERSLSIWGE